MRSVIRALVPVVGIPVVGITVVVIPVVAAPADRIGRRVDARGWHQSSIGGGRDASRGVGYRGEGVDLASGVCLARVVTRRGLKQALDHVWRQARYALEQQSHCAGDYWRRH